MLTVGFSQRMEWCAVFVADSDIGSALDEQQRNPRSLAPHGHQQRGRKVTFTRRFDDCTILNQHPGRIIGSAMRRKSATGYSRRRSSHWRPLRLEEAPSPTDACVATPSDATVLIRRSSSR